VGEDEERSMVKLHDKLSSNFDLIPPGAPAADRPARSMTSILALTLCERWTACSADRRPAERPGQAVLDVGNRRSAVSGASFA
jgi:hypothetical protein